MAMKSKIKKLEHVINSAAADYYMHYGTKFV